MWMCNASFRGISAAIGMVAYCSCAKRDSRIGVRLVL
jgi:hypothetical protein